MASSSDGRISQPVCAPCLTNDFSIDQPIRQWLFHKLLLSAPWHLERPNLVANPVTDPVVRSNVN